MLRPMRFAKLHGLGNDFVLLDLRGEAGAAPPSPQRATELCDRHRGIGADGVLTLLEGDRFVIHNADGSVPEMCGNGARCAALWIATDGGARPARARVVLQTDAGPRPCAVQAETASFGQVEVEMGVAEVGATRELAGGFTAVPVSTGNPHRVVFTDGDLRVLAERGAGLTQACGTGACAIAAAAAARGDVDASTEVIVELPGGALSIRRDPLTGQLFMRGPAQLVFTGQLPD